MAQYHIPVILDEVLELTQPQSGKKIIDCTLGGGGHTQAFLDRKAEVLAIDQDQAAIDYVEEHLDKKYPLTLVRDSFTNLAQIARTYNFYPSDVVFFDLGVSSYQFDTGERGFSFQQDAELDMRMDQRLTVKAKDLLAVLGEKELTKLFTVYGGELLSVQIAREIVRQRKYKPITTTTQLASLITSIYKRRYTEKSTLNPATKVFQALRIAVNDEINSLRSVLPQAVEVLKPGGRLVIIDFHYGEDDVIKAFCKDSGQLKPITNKAVTASEEELNRNHRSRSARLRAYTKLP